MSKEFDKKAAAAKQQLETMFADTEKFIKTLSSDYKFSRDILKGDSQNQMLRRMAVRNFCALVEGQIHQWKWMALLFYKLFEVSLTDSEVAILREETYDLDNKGEATSRRMNIPIQKNFKFGCAMFTRVYGCTKIPDFKTEGWDCVLKVFDVRNRLMHPKHAKGVDVSEEEILFLQKAAKWFSDVRSNLFNSTNLDQVLESCPSNN